MAGPGKPKKSKLVKATIKGTLQSLKPKNKQERAIKKATKAYKKTIREEFAVKMKTGGSFAPNRSVQSSCKQGMVRDANGKCVMMRKMKEGGFPDLTGDNKVTKADILKGRGVFKEGGSSKNWIQKVTKSIKRRGTEGVCTGSKFGGPTCPPGSKRYNLAKTFKKIAKNK